MKLSGLWSLYLPYQVRKLVVLPQNFQFAVALVSLNYFSLDSSVYTCIFSEMQTCLVVILFPLSDIAGLECGLEK